MSAVFSPRLDHRHPWLVLTFGETMRVLGWPPVGPSRGAARAVAWLQVRDRDLPVDLDPVQVYRDRARQDGIEAGIGLMTAAAIADRGFDLRHDESGLGAATVATVGLGNGESVVPAMTPPSGSPRIGTVNLVVAVSAALTDAAALEALSIVAQARTTAILAKGLRTPDGRPITGTGTDCIVLASSCTGRPLPYCGLHTHVGRLIATSVWQATTAAVSSWKEPRGQSIMTCMHDCHAIP